MANVPANGRSLIATRARQLGLDPNAVLAVVSVEGLSGGIGDGGHAFGPFQLNNAGGVITGKFPGASQDTLHRWAWSPQGIDFALSRIAGVARGLTGKAAVNAIVRRFERPADPNGEVQRALGVYGTTAPTARIPTSVGLGAPQPKLAATVGGPPALPSVPRGLSGALGSVVNTTNQLFGLPALPAGLTAPPVPVSAPVAVAAGAPTALPQSPRPAKPSAPTPFQPPRAPGRLTALPAGFATHAGIQLDSAILPAVTDITHRFGVQVNSGYRDPQHNADVGGAPNSDHLRGDGIDFTGPPDKMRALYQWAQGRFPYVEPWDQAHGDHVHISFRR